MKTVDKQQFIKGYTKILTQSWSSDEFSRNLESDPRGVLAGMGLDIAPDSVVEIVRSHSDPPDLDKQLAMWATGMTTGHFVLYVPYLPQLDIRDLDDEDLGDLAGGAAGLCCAPCCCQSA